MITSRLFPYFKILCIPFRDGSGPFLFPPLQDSPGFLPFRAFPSPLSFAPPHPHPSQVPPAAQVGGGANLHFGPLDRKPGEDFGRPSAGWL